MEDFVSKLKETATKVAGEAGKLASTVGEKTGALVSQTKMNYIIGSNEGKIKDILSEVGKVVYDEFKNGSAVPDELAEKLSKVNELYDEIAELKAKIADMKNAVICEECGEYNAQNSTFCSKCGAQIK